MHHVLNLLPTFPSDWVIPQRERKLIARCYGKKPFLLQKFPKCQDTGNEKATSCLHLHWLVHECLSVWSALIDIGSIILKIKHKSNVTTFRNNKIINLPSILVSLRNKLCICLCNYIENICINMLWMYVKIICTRMK